MKLLHAAAALVAALCLGAPAFAQDTQTNLNVKDSAGTTQTTCAFTVGGALVVCHIEEGVDSSGVHHQIITDSTGHILLGVVPLPTNASIETGGNLAGAKTDLDTLLVNLGAPGATACATDTASCSTNQQLQRVAQRESSILTALGSPFQAGGSIGNTGFNVNNSPTVLPGNTPNTTPWLFQIGNGTNSASIKASVTAALTTDPSLVVQESPNSFLAALPLAQASTTSGQKGLLDQCAVTTASPTYTTGQTDPCSMDVNGGIRVNVIAGGAGGGVTTANSGAFAAGGATDGWNLTEGAKADTAWTSGSGSIVAILKAIAGNAATGVGTPGAAFLTGVNTVQIGGSDGTDLRIATTDASGHFIIEPGNTANTTAWLFQSAAITSGGSTPFHGVSAASNNSTLVSTGAHTIYTLDVEGLNTAVGDVRIYDSAGAPTCSSSTGVIKNVPVITTSGNEGGLVIPIPPQGIKVTNGFGYCITGADADNDNTNAPTGVHINGSYN